MTEIPKHYPEGLHIQVLDLQRKLNEFVHEEVERRVAKRLVELTEINMLAKSSLGYIAGYCSGAKDVRSQECYHVATKTLEQIEIAEKIGGGKSFKHSPTCVCGNFDCHP